MKAFHVRGIVWETDGKHPALPVEATGECEGEERIADALSDVYGRLGSDFVVVEIFDIHHTLNQGGADGSR